VHSHGEKYTKTDRNLEGCRRTAPMEERQFFYNRAYTKRPTKQPDMEWKKNIKNGERQRKARKKLT